MLCTCFRLGARANVQLPGLRFRTSISRAAGSCCCFEFSCSDVGETFARFIIFNYLLLFCKTSIQIFQAWRCYSFILKIRFYPACVRVYPSKTKIKNLNKTLVCGTIGLHALKILDVWSLKLQVLFFGDVTRIVTCNLLNLS